MHEEKGKENPSCWRKVGWRLGASPQAILTFTAFCVGVSVVITWVFNRSGESLPMAMLLHAGSNNSASVPWFGMFTTLNPYDPTPNCVSVIAFGAPVLVLVVATRGRLDYRPEHHEEPADDDPVTHAGGTAGGAPSRARSEDAHAVFRASRRLCRDARSIRPKRGARMLRPRRTKRATRERTTDL